MGYQTPNPPRHSALQFKGYPATPLKVVNLNVCSLFENGVRFKADRVSN